VSIADSSADANSMPLLSHGGSGNWAAQVHTRTGSVTAPGEEQQAGSFTESPGREVSSSAAAAAAAAAAGSSSVLTIAAINAHK
jgi:hypothetical protein